MTTKQSYNVEELEGNRTELQKLLPEILRFAQVPRISSPHELFLCQNHNICLSITKTIGPVNHKLETIKQS